MSKVAYLGDKARPLGKVPQVYTSLSEPKAIDMFLLAVILVTFFVSRDSI